uniref:Uncharacterized protein n=1 Tax=Arion vulgaris TaxID=1028688 RepID=A0A0B7BCX1_9EUPU
MDDQMGSRLLIGQSNSRMRVLYKAGHSQHMRLESQEADLRLRQKDIGDLGLRDNDREPWNRREARKIRT